jgi:hypothetical protein
MAQSFVDVLKELRGGQAIDDLTEEMESLVEAIRQSGRGGKLTLTITAKPASKGSISTLMLDAAIAVKKPIKDTESTIFYATDENVLQRNDPRQPELTGLRRPAEVRTMKDAKEAKAINGE